MPSEYQKFKFHTVLLHWIVGLGIIGLIAIGLYMAQNKAYALYPIHKSIGVILLGFIVVRVLFRIKEGWPKNISTGKKWEHALAKIVHWVLILGTLALPISGVIMSYYGGHGVAVFGLDVLSKNYDPALGRAIPINAEWSKTGSFVHEWAGKALIGVITLHVLGALKHHVLDKDNTLRRMLGR